MKAEIRFQMAQPAIHLGLQALDTLLYTVNLDKQCPYLRPRQFLP